MKFLIRSFRTLCLFLSVAICYAQEATPLLFDQNEIMEMKLEIPLKEVIQDTKEREKRTGVLSYVDSDDEWHQVPVKVKVRGNTRSNKSICRFPPLFLHFNKDKTKKAYEMQHKHIHEYFFLKKAKRKY